MQTIILIRHGYPTTWDEKPKPRGTPAHERLDPGLAEIGFAQARRCAAHVAKQVAAGGAANVVISSPFRRCLETAAVVAGDLAVTADWRVGEVLLSQVLGCPFSPLNAMDPEWADRRQGAGKPAHPESDQTIRERLTRLTLDLKGRKPLAQRIVIVSHAIILRELVGLMTGRSVTVDWHPGAITTLTRATPIDRLWRLAGGLASVAHLGADDRCEPVDQIVHTYHPLDSRS